MTVVGIAPGRPGQRPSTLAAWIDPSSGRVIDVAGPRRELRGVFLNLHGNLMPPGVGRAIVGWLGVAMLISCITGVILWWSRNNAVSRAVRWTRSPTTTSNLHHSVGFWIRIPLAILSPASCANCTWARGAAWPGVWSSRSPASRPPSWA